MLNANRGLDPQLPPAERLPTPCPRLSLCISYQSPQLHGSACGLRSHGVRPDSRQRLLFLRDSLACRPWLEADLELSIRLCDDLQRSQGYIKDQTARLDGGRESLANLQSSSSQCQLLLKSESRSLQSPAWQITFMQLCQ